MRGTAHQVYEKYCSLGRDSLSAGDRVAAETYFQHAEHYFRVLNSSTDPQPDELNGRSQKTPAPDSNRATNGDASADDMEQGAASGPAPEKAAQSESKADQSKTAESGTEEAASDGAAAGDPTRARDSSGQAPPDGNEESKGADPAPRGRRRTLRSRKAAGNCGAEDKHSAQQEGPAEPKQADGDTETEASAAKLRAARQGRRPGRPRKNAENQARDASDGGDQPA